MKDAVVGGYEDPDIPLGPELGMEAPLLPSEYVGLGGMSRHWNQRELDLKPGLIVKVIQ